MRRILTNLLFIVLLLFSTSGIPVLSLLGVEKPIACENITSVSGGGGGGTGSSSDAESDQGMTVSVDSVKKIAKSGTGGTFELREVAANSIGTATGNTLTLKLPSDFEWNGMTSKDIALAGGFVTGTVTALTGNTTNTLHITFTSPVRAARGIIYISPKMRATNDATKGEIAVSINIINAAGNEILDQALIIANYVADIELPSRQNVTLNKPWTIKFNKEIDVASITNDNIYVNDKSNAITIQPDPNEPKNIIVNPPIGGWNPNRTNYLHIAKGVKSKGGQSLNNSVFMSFKTQEVLPSTPTGLTATAISSTNISLSWNLASRATAYDIYSSTSQTGTYYKIGTTTTTSYDHVGLTANTTYWYKIRAINNVGEGDSTEAINATTKKALTAKERADLNKKLIEAIDMQITITQYLIDMSSSGYPSGLDMSYWYKQLNFWKQVEDNIREQLSEE